MGFTLYYNSSGGQLYANCAFKRKSKCTMHFSAFFKISNPKNTDFNCLNFNTDRTQLHMARHENIVMFMSRPIVHVILSNGKVLLSTNLNKI